MSRSARQPFSLAVLAGGRSSRMGEPKAVLRWGDGTLIEAVVKALGRVAAETLIVGGDPGLAGLGGVSPARWIPDAQEGAGPLAGLAAALVAARKPWLALVACDMPLVDPAVWLALMDERCGSWAVLPQGRAGHPEPLHALYHRRCLAEVRRALSGGDRSMTGWLERVPHRLVPAAALGTNASRSWANINTPQELEATRSSLRGSGLGHISG